MSRITYRDIDSAEDQWAAIRWGGAAKQAVNGKRGQAALKELVGALEALPSKRLITDQWAANGDVCALGALDVHNLAKRTGMNWDAARLVVQQCTVQEWDDYWGDKYDDDVEGSVALAQSRLGLTYTLAWVIVEANDEQFYVSTPEERYRKVVDWAKRQIHA